MSGRKLVIAGFLAGAAAVGAPALAVASSSGPPGQSAVDSSSDGVSTMAAPSANGSALCTGGVSHGTVVRTDDRPRFFTGTTTYSQAVTAQKKYGNETLVVTFAAEVYADPTLEWIQADVKVDGRYAEPYDTANPNSFKSGDSYTNASLTRCIRVKPGVHTVSVVLRAVGTEGDAWVDDAALRIDKLN